jgi:hypothetical protein
MQMGREQGQSREAASSGNPYNILPENCFESIFYSDSTTAQSFQLIACKDLKTFNLGKFFIRINLGSPHLQLQASPASQQTLLTSDRISRQQFS